MKNNLSFFEDFLKYCDDRGLIWYEGSESFIIVKNNNLYNCYLETKEIGLYLGNFYYFHGLWRTKNYSSVSVIKVFNFMRLHLRANVMSNGF